MADEPGPGISPSGNAATGNAATTAQLLEMRRLIKEHLAASEMEVVVIVEGIDPHSSNSFQARHSYTRDDIVFDQSFEACMSVDADGMARLNWDTNPNPDPNPNPNLNPNPNPNPNPNVHSTRVARDHLLGLTLPSSVTRHPSPVTDHPSPSPVTLHPSPSPSPQAPGTGVHSNSLQRSPGLRRYLRT